MVLLLTISWQDLSIFVMLLAGLLIGLEYLRRLLTKPARIPLWADGLDGQLQPVWVLNPQSVILHCNPAAQGICEVAAEPAQQLFWELPLWQTSSAGAQLRQAIQAVARTGERQLLELVCPRQDQPLLTLTALVRAVPDQRGNVVALIVEATDTSELTALRRERESHQAQLLALLSAAGGFAFDWDVSANQVHRILPPDSLSWEAEQIQGTFEEMLARVHPEDRTEYQRTILQALESGTEYFCEYRLLCPGQQDVWILDRGRVERLPSGRAVRLFGISLECNDLLQTRRALHQVNARLHKTVALLDTLLANAPIGFAFLDLEGDRVQLNSQIVDIFGQAPASLTQERWTSLLREQWPELDNLLEQVKTTQQPITCLEQHDGSRWWEISCYPVSVQEQLLGLGVILHDITHRKRNELAVRRRNARLLNRVRRHLVALERANQRQHESEHRFRELADSCPAIIWMGTPDPGQCTFVNRTASDFFGRTTQDLLGSGWMNNIHPEDRARTLSLYQAAVRQGQPIELEYRLQGSSGDYRWFSDRAIPRQVQLDASATYVGVMIDITARRQAEEALAGSEMRYRTLAESVPQLVWVCDSQGRALYFNQRWYEYTGQSPDDTTEIDWSEVIHEEDRGQLFQVLLASGQHSPHHQCEVRVWHTRSQHYRWNLVQVNALGDQEAMSWLGTCTDIHDDRAAREALRHSLRQKESLLQEIHHRVKNNLQVIASLLNMQAHRLPAGEARTVLADSRERVAAMALVHEFLYRSEDLAQIDMSQYLRNLLQFLTNTNDLSNRTVEIHLDVEEVHLDLDRAVPCGLIVNELFSNAVKHAFPPDRAGRIWVSLKAQDDCLQVTVEDNGVGLPPAFNPARLTSLGLRLVERLVRQIKGTLSFAGERGARVQFLFPRTPLGVTCP